MALAASKIIVVGSSNTDMIISMDCIPRPGETVLGGEFSTAAGGKGANQAVAVARAGGDVTLIARIGKDAFGDRAILGFIKDGLHVEQIIRDESAPTGVAFIFVARDGQNSIAVAPGANRRLCPGDIRKAAPAFQNAAVLVMQLETPLDTVLAAAESAVRCGAAVILNPAPAQPLPSEMLRQVSVLTPNETEAELLTGIRVVDHASAGRAADQLLARGPASVIITLGAGGTFVAGHELRKWFPAFAVQAVDTTAAGDVFNGALAVALAERQPMTTAVRFASAAAAISVTRAGAQPSAPFRAEIDHLLRSDRPVASA